MDKTHFNVSAEILQKNAMKASIRDLNAEFQMKGGRVTYKTSKKGDNYRLTHPDPEYLEEFRIRLFIELGLMEAKEIPKEKKVEEREAPRYGEEHKLRRGWNVRSPKEFNEGKYNRDERRSQEGGSPWNRWKESRGRKDQDERRPHRERESDSPSDRRPQKPVRSSEFFRKTPKKESMGQEFTNDPQDENTRSFEERWGDISEYMTIIERSLKAGAVDDGQIIKFAYDDGMDPDKIKTLKKLLWDNRCKGPRKQCPHGKKKFRFEDLMKVCSGKVDGWEKIDSPFVQFLDLWMNNMEEMYGGIREKLVDVQGKISSYKAVMRSNHEHLKILVYDTVVKPEGEKKEIETRKLWLKVNMKDYDKLTSGADLRIDDIISFQGKCVYDNYFHDYWVIELTKLEVTTPSVDGEKLRFEE